RGEGSWEARTAGPRLILRNSIRTGGPPEIVALRRGRTDELRRPEQPPKGVFLPGSAVGIGEKCRNKGALGRALRRSFREQLERAGTQLLVGQSAQGTDVRFGEKRSLDTALFEPFDQSDDPLRRAQQGVQRQFAIAGREVRQSTQQRRRHLRRLQV